MLRYWETQFALAATLFPLQLFSLSLPNITTTNIITNHVPPLQHAGPVCHKSTAAQARIDDTICQPALQSLLDSIDIHHGLIRWGGDSGHNQQSWPSTGHLECVISVFDPGRNPRTAEDIFGYAEVLGHTLAILLACEYGGWMAIGRYWRVGIGARGEGDLARSLKIA